MTGAHIAITALVAVLVVSNAEARQSPWYVLYDEAIKHIQAGESQQAEIKLLEAKKNGPPSGPSVLRYGSVRASFFPDYYLGVVYVSTRRWQEALRAFDNARKAKINARDEEFRLIGTFEGTAKAGLATVANNPAAPPAPTTPEPTPTTPPPVAPTAGGPPPPTATAPGGGGTPAGGGSRPVTPVPQRRVGTPPPGLPSPVVSPGGLGVAMVPVFYATDREALTAGPLNYGMTRNPGGVLFLGRFDVSIPRDERHRIGRIERPTIWTFWREDPNQHFVIANRRRHSYDEFYADLRGVVAKSDRKEAFVFIHGFNVGFEAAVFRTAQIAYDLGFDGAPILYSWPSVAALTPTGYAMDVENNDWTVPHLGWFLEDVARKAGAARVHLIAHGVGNKALLKALDRIPRVTTARFAQVVLTAPDIDVDTFDQLADAVRRNAMRTTLYASSSDRALVASKRIHPYRRAGDASAGVVVVPGIDSVDVTAVDTDFVDHSFHAENRSVISDMFLLITQGLMPSQRPKLRPVGTAPRQFWRFVP